MSTSKENYDHLIYEDGNYGIDISKGIWPGSGQAPGVKGNKGEAGYGEKGSKGQKGQPGTNGSDGDTGGVGQKGAPGPQGTKGGKGQKGQKGSAGEKGGKGSKGVGQKGEKGETAATPVFEFKGSVATIADLPPTGNNVGDVYQVTSNDFLYAWDGTQWVTIAEAIGVVKGQKGEQGQKGVDGALGQKGEAADKGQKGATGGQGFKGQKGVEATKGNKGQKGGKGEPGVAGSDGTNGSKGNKGEKGLDPTALNSYYTKQQTDSLIEDFRAPQFAFDIDAYGLSGSPLANANKIVSGAVDFNSVDQNADVYNTGIVTINSAVTVSNSPIAAAELMVVNYVAAGGPANIGDVRDVDYKLLQYIFALNENDGSELGYWRFVEPGGGLFGAWNLGQFDKDNYYTKAQVDSKDREYTFTSSQGADNTKTALTLTDDASATSVVNLNVSGGLSAISNGNTITISASAISGNVTFLGGINAPTDPATLETTPNSGDYFIYTNNGTAWNGDAVTEGDWAIYKSEAPAGWLNLDYQTSTIGVASVTVAGGLLTETGTASDPIIGLTAADIESNVLGPYAKTADVTAAIAAVTLNDLANVNAASPSNSAIIRYNTASSKWELSTSYTTSGADTEFLSKTQGGTVAKKLMVSRNQQSAASNSFVLQGRVSTNGSDTAQLFKTYIQPTSSPNKDYIQYFGETGTSDTQIQTKASVTSMLGSYLPLIAGQANPITGNLYITGSQELILQASNGANKFIVNGSNGNLTMAGTIQFDSNNAQNTLTATGTANNQFEFKTTNASFTSQRRMLVGGGNGALTVYSQGSATVFEVDNNGTVSAPSAASTASTSKQLVTLEQVQALLNATSAAVPPIGSIMAWPSGGQPPGWLKMNGQSYNPTDYPVLDSVLAQMAGYVQGTIPDWKGLHLVAYGGEFTESLGTVIGSRTAMPNLPFGTATDGEHFHKYGSNDRYGGGTTKSAYDATPRLNSFNTTSAGAHVHTIVGGDPVTNPPCAVIQWIIKTDG